MVVKVRGGASSGFIIKGKQKMLSMLYSSAGMIPEFVAKWIAGHGILPGMLCMEEEEADQSMGSEVNKSDSGGSMAVDETPRKRPLRSLSCGPLIGEIACVVVRF